MASLAEFTFFSRLPSELRLTIWERVPQPARIIGQVPCPNCMSGESNETLQSCADKRHPDWHLRYVVQPRHAAIFPPLHSCQESRRAWLPRFFQPPRHVQIDDEINVRFDVPFISYDADTIAILNVWTGDDICDHDFGDSQRYIDPFVGLDRAKIQHAGLWALSGRFIPAMVNLDIPSLRSIRSISLLVPGPELGLHSSISPGPWQEMCEYDLQSAEFEVRNVSPAQITSHPFFTSDRLRTWGRQPLKDAPPLHDQLNYLRIWLWHMHLPDFVGTDFRVYAAALGYMGEPLEEGEQCPLELAACTDGHTRQDIFDWDAPYSISCKFVCEEHWMKRLADVGVFDEEPYGDFAAFYTLKEQTMASGK